MIFTSGKIATVGDVFIQQDNRSKAKDKNSQYNTHLLFDSYQQAAYTVIPLLATKHCDWTLFPCIFTAPTTRRFERWIHKSYSKLSWNRNCLKQNGKYLMI